MPCHVLRIRWQKHNPIQLPCTVAGCPRWFRNPSSRTKHMRSRHGSHHHHYPTQPQPSGLSATDTPQVSDDDDDMIVDEDPGMFQQPGLSLPQSPSDAIPSPSNNDILSGPFTPIDVNFSSRPPTPINNSANVPTSRQYHPLLDGNFVLIRIAYQRNNTLYRKDL
jgi:hypothetical protein